MFRDSLARISKLVGLSADSWSGFAVPFAVDIHRLKRNAPWKRGGCILCESFLERAPTAPAT